MVFGPDSIIGPIDLSIPSSWTTVLIGPSGSGKSTILRLIIGLLTPTSGRVMVGGEPLLPINLDEQRRKMGYVIQDGGLFPHLTGEENVTLMASYIQKDNVWIAERLKELCKLTNFPAQALKRYPSELSGGQQQRLGLMRALMLDPEVLLLDEPLSSLDPMIKFELRSDLKEIFDELDKTVVLVTHDIDEAAFFGGGIVLLKDGSVVQSGAIEEIVENPVNEFVYNFIQTGMGLARGYGSSKM